VLTAVIYSQAYNQVLANQQQQQAAQLLASANPAVAATSGIASLGLLGLASQKEGESFALSTSIYSSHRDCLLLSLRL
jgi:cystathionine beta-lyase/cystathionine gamma-synthase